MFLLGTVPSDPVVQYLENEVDVQVAENLQVPQVAEVAEIGVPLPAEPQPVLVEHIKDRIGPGN